MSLAAGTIQFLPFFIPQATLIANLSVELIAPDDGYITEMQGIVQVANTAAGTITVLTGTAGAVTVAGLTLPIGAAAAKGARATIKATSSSPTRFVAKGERIQVKPNAFATAGAVDGYLTFRSTNADPAL